MKYQNRLIIAVGIWPLAFQTFFPMLFHFTIRTPAKQEECDNYKDAPGYGGTGECLSVELPVDEGNKEYGKKGSDGGEDR